MGLYISSHKLIRMAIRSLIGAIRASGLQPCNQKPFGALPEARFLLLLDVPLEFSVYRISGVRAFRVQAAFLNSVHQTPNPT